MINSKQITALVLTISLCLSTSVVASPLEHIRSALATNHAYLQAETNIEIAKKSLEVRKALRLPQVRASANLRVDKPKAQGNSGPPDRLTKNVIISQQLFDLHDDSNLDITELNLRLATLNAENIRQQILLSTYKAYLGTALAHASLELIDRRLLILDEQLRNVNTSLLVGKATRLDELNVKSQLAALQAERINSENNLNKAYRQLASVSGQDVYEVLSLTNIFPISSSVIEWLEQVEDAPALQTALLAVTIKEKQINGSYGALWPNIDVAANTNLNDNHALNIQFGIPVYSSGAASAQISVLNLERDRLITAHQQALKNALVNTRNAHSDMEFQLSRSDALQNTVMIAKERLELTQESVNLNVSLISDILSAEADLASAELSLLQARHAYLEAWLDLLAVTGNLDIQAVTDLEVLFS